MTKEIGKMKIEDIVKEIAEKKDVLRKARFSATMSREKNSKNQANLKKDIARLMTEQTKRHFTNVDALEA